MPQYNVMNLRDTYGAGVADREASERHALQQDAGRQAIEMNRQNMAASRSASKSELQRQNTLRLLAGIRQVRANPGTLPNVAQELSQAGILDQNAVGDMIQRAQSNPQEFVQSLAGVEAGLMTALGESPTQGTDPTSIREYKLAQSQGFQGSFADWKKENKSGGISINQYPAPEKGYQYELDESGRPTGAVPIPGGSVDREIQELEAKTQASAATNLAGAKNVDILLSEAIENADGWTTGLVGGQLKAVPGTRAFDLQQNLLTIRANIGFDRLQRMREESKTGGALGQVAIQELDALQASIRSLEQSQSKGQFVNNLKAVKARYGTAIQAYGAAMGQDDPFQAQWDAAPSGSVLQAPDGTMRRKP